MIWLVTRGYLVAIGQAVLVLCSDTERSKKDIWWLIVRLNDMKDAFQEKFFFAPVINK